MVDIFFKSSFSRPFLKRPQSWLTFPRVGRPTDWEGIVHFVPPQLYPLLCLFPSIIIIVPILECQS